MGPEHLYFVQHDTDEMTLLWCVRDELWGVRRDWMKKCKRPVPGRDEIADLLDRPNPYQAVEAMIEHQRAVAMALRDQQRQRSNRRARSLFATAMRKLIMIQLLGQTALRIGMLPELTVGPNQEHHLRLRGGKPPFVEIPARMFKNEDSMVFRSGPYRRELAERSGIVDDLALYMEEARPILLDGSSSELLFPVKSGTPIGLGKLRQEIAEISSAAIGANALPGRRLIFLRSALRPHHFRDILATQILHDTNRDYALAADAIHVTEQTCRDYYAHDTPAMRRDRLEEALRNMGRVKAA